MDILFAHNNYPAQFVHLLEALKANTEHRVVFLSQYIKRGVEVHGLQHVKVPLRKQHSSKNKTENFLVDTLHTGEDYANAMLKLKKDGFFPDIVYDHAGFGCGMYIPDIFPKAARISYCEWFYTKGADYGFSKPVEKRSPADFARSRQHNLYILDGLREADLGISPTQWQCSQFPMEYRQKMHVLHDGIDTDFFCPQQTKLTLPGLDLEGATELVTYTTRGFEPYRGFPEFYTSLPRILKARPGCHIILMGNDSTHYGPKPAEGKTWRQLMQEKVQVDTSRVHFLPYSDYETYRSVLRASSVHVYLTVPFVLSWSMLEAMACGCLLVASDTEPVREVIYHTKNGLLVPFYDTKALAETVIEALKNQKQLYSLRENARQTIMEQYALSSLLPQHLGLIDKAIEQKKHKTALQSTQKAFDGEALRLGLKTDDDVMDLVREERKRKATQWQ